MRKFSFIPALLLLAFFATAMTPAPAPAPVQTANLITYTTNDQVIGGRMFTFTATLDSADKDTSYNFELARYDHVSWTTNPMRYRLTLTTDGDSANVTSYIDGSMDGTNWNAVDTIAAITEETSPGTGTIDFNNLKYPYYRLRQVDAAKVQNDTTTTATLLLWVTTDK